MSWIHFEESSSHRYSHLELPDIFSFEESDVSLYFCSQSHVTCQAGDMIDAMCGRYSSNSMIHYDTDIHTTTVSVCPLLCRVRF
jgi:hypothetical protein